MVRSVEITSIHRMTPRVKQFEPEADGPFSYEPGQHTRLHVDPADLPPEARSDGECEDDDGDQESEGGDGDGGQGDEGDDGNDGDRE